MSNKCTSRYNSNRDTFPTAESTGRTQRQLDIDRQMRNLDRSVSSILSGDYQSRRAASLRDTSPSTESRYSSRNYREETNEPERNADGEYSYRLHT